MRLTPGLMFGNTVRAYAGTETILTETSYLPGTKLPKHSHESAYFCFVLQGMFTEAYGKQSRLYKPATLIFHPPDETHSDRFYENGGRCFNIQVGRAWLQRAKEHSVVLNQSAHFRSGLVATLGMRLYKEFREMDEASPLAIEGLVLEIMAEASRRSAADSFPKRSRWLDQAKEILHERFAEHLTLTEIAESVNRHPVHLAREFRKRHRRTMGEYIRELRVEFACRELARSAASLTEIALAAGFSHQSHFSRTFKRLTGMTPGKYRALSRRR